MTTCSRYSLPKMRLPCMEYGPATCLQPLRQRADGVTCHALGYRGVYVSGGVTLWKTE